MTLLYSPRPHSRTPTATLLAVLALTLACMAHATAQLVPPPGAPRLYVSAEQRARLESRGVSKISAKRIALMPSTKKRPHLPLTLNTAYHCLQWEHKDARKSLFIDDILEVGESDLASEIPESSEQTVGIWYDKFGALKSLHLVFRDAAHAHEWRETLREYAAALRAAVPDGSHEAEPYADVRRAAALPMPQSERAALFRAMNLPQPLEGELLRAIAGRSADLEPLLDAHLGRSDIHELFTALRGGGDVDDTEIRLTARQFASFFAEQNPDASEAAAAYAFAAFSADADTMDERGFAAYLASGLNGVLLRSHTREKRDDGEGYPLQDFFIASSHNTYIMGDQIMSSASKHGYSNAFTKNCRSIELDINSTPAGPMIYHRNTPMKPVTVAEALRHIRDAAFVHSSYPVTLSLEMRCTREDHDAVAALLRRYLGEDLYVPDAESGGGGEDEDGQMQPYLSPLQLERKFIVKAKNNPRRPSFGGMAMRRRSSSSGGSGGSNSLPRPSPPITRVFSDSNAAPSDFSAVAIDVPGAGPSSIASSVSSAAAAGLLPVLDTSPTELMSRPADNVDEHEQLGALIYLRGVSLFAFDSVATTHRRTSISSLSETTASALLRYEAARLLAYNSARLSRVYPKAARISSRNYDPRRFWAAGCQMVALNYQTSDLAMEFHAALFAQNGASGYVLKPWYLRGAAANAPAAALDPLPVWRLSVRVISGQRLPHPEPKDRRAAIDAFVAVELYTEGGAEDAAPQTLVTPAVAGNGYNPVWSSAAVVGRRRRRGEAPSGNAAGSGSGSDAPPRSKRRALRRLLTNLNLRSGSHNAASVQSRGLPSPATSESDSALVWDLCSSEDDDDDDEAEGDCDEVYSGRLPGTDSALLSNGNAEASDPLVLLSDSMDTLRVPVTPPASPPAATTTTTHEPERAAALRATFVSRPFTKPELAFLRLRVGDRQSRTESLASWTGVVNALAEGYRYLPLSAGGKVLRGRSLFVHITKTRIK